MELGVGAYFGERSLLAPGEKRAANVIAVRPCVSLHISKRDFEREFGSTALTEAIERDRLLREQAIPSARDPTSPRSHQPAIPPARDPVSPRSH